MNYLIARIDALQEQLEWQQLRVANTPGLIAEEMPQSKTQQQLYLLQNDLFNALFFGNYMIANHVLELMIGINAQIANCKVDTLHYYQDVGVFEQREAARKAAATRAAELAARRIISTQVKVANQEVAPVAASDVPVTDPAVDADTEAVRVIQAQVRLYLAKVAADRAEIARALKRKGKGGRHKVGRGGRSGDRGSHAPKPITGAGVSKRGRGKSTASTAKSFTLKSLVAAITSLPKETEGDKLHIALAPLVKGTSPYTSKKSCGLVKLTYKDKPSMFVYIINRDVAAILVNANKLLVWLVKERYAKRLNFLAPLRIVVSNITAVVLKEMDSAAEVATLSVETPEGNAVMTSDGVALTRPVTVVAMRLFNIAHATLTNACPWLRPR